MTKPIDLEELEARIWVHLRKENNINGVDNRSVKHQEKIFEVQENLVFFKGEKLDLTALESEILHYFIKNKNSVIKRHELAEILSTYGTQRSLDNHIKNIRKKLGESAKEAKYLKTVYGVGYFFNF